jgi:hypothetical protein
LDEVWVGDARWRGPRKAQFVVAHEVAVTGVKAWSDTAVRFRIR